MRRIGPALLLVFLPALLIPNPGWAATDVTVSELLQDPAAFEGRTMSVVGELVGDYGFRRDGWAWSQLNGDSYATAPLLEGGALSGSNAGIGIRAPAHVIRALDPPGDYHHRGPLVRATGTWRYHDEDRGGETYLDVTSIEVLRSGAELSEGLNPVVAGVGAFLVVIALWLGYRSRKRSTG